MLKLKTPPHGGTQQTKDLQEASDGATSASSAVTALRLPNAAPAPSVSEYVRVRQHQERLPRRTTKEWKAERYYFDHKYFY